MTSTSHGGLAEVGKFVFFFVTTCVSITQTQPIECWLLLEESYCSVDGSEMTTTYYLSRVVAPDGYFRKETMS